MAKPKQRLGKGVTVIARVYLLCDIGQQWIAKKIAVELEELGYFISSQWLSDEAIATKSEQALRNLHDILTSDIVFVIGVGKSWRVAYELGFARAAGLRIVLGGYKSSELYDTLPQTVYATSDDALMAFRKISMFRFKKKYREDSKDEVDNLTDGE